MKQNQQGDVLFLRLEKPMELKNKVKPDKRGVVIAEGEVTGHFHGIECTDDAELYREGERLLLNVLNKTEVKHQEHKPITLDPGIYEIGIVKEYDYFKEMERPVVD